MIDKSQLIWSHHEGRDADGDRFNLDAMTHGSGRILAKIFGPRCGDEFAYRVSFYFTVPKKLLPNQNEAFDFIDFESARQFAETVTCRSTPECLPPVLAASRHTARTREKVGA